MTVGFINPPYSARDDEGPMIFIVGVTSNHILDRDIELSFSTADGLIAGESLYLFFDAHNNYLSITFTTRTDFAATAGLDYTSIINMPIILRPGMQT